MDFFTYLLYTNLVPLEWRMTSLSWDCTTFRKGHRTSSKYIKLFYFLHAREKKKSEYTNNLFIIKGSNTHCLAFSHPQTYYSPYRLLLTQTTSPHLTSFENCVCDCSHPNPAGASRSPSSMRHRLLLRDCSPSREISWHALAHQASFLCQCVYEKRM